MSRRRAWFTILVPCLVGVITFLAAAKFISTMPTTYTARALVVFAPKPAKSGSVPSSEVVVLDANNAVSIVTSPTVIAEVSDVTGVPQEQLSSATRATIIPGTATMAIDVTLEEAQASAEAANAYASTLSKALRSSPTVTVTVIGSTEPPSQPSGPPTTLLLVASLILATLVVVLTLAAIIVVSRIIDRGGARGVLEDWLRPGGSGVDS